MSKEKNTREKICAFYASDYHFEMISLPYINEKLEKNEEVVILSENDLEETINKVLEKINLKEEKKKKILKLNWNNDKEKFDSIKEKCLDKKDMVVFIKGNKKYIQSANQNIEKFVPKDKSLEIIDCYNIEEINNNVQDIIQNYDNVLQTAGKKF